MIDTTLYARRVLPNGRVRYTVAGCRWDKDVWPAGWHLVGVQPGWKTIMYRVQIDKAHFAAVLAEQREAVSEALRTALQGRPQPDSERTRKAIEAFRAAGGLDGDAWIAPTAADIIDAILGALEGEP